MPEALLTKLAKKDGVIGFHIGCEFHSRKFFEYRAKQEGKMFWDTRDIGEKEKLLKVEDIDEDSRRRFQSEGIAAPYYIKLTPEEWLVRPTGDCVDQRGHGEPRARRRAGPRGARLAVSAGPATRRENPPPGGGVGLPRADRPRRCPTPAPRAA